MQMNVRIGRSSGFYWENGEVELLVLDLIQVNQLSHSVSEGVGYLEQGFDNGVAVSRTA